MTKNLSDAKSVSVVLCTYNGARYLSAQLDTLLQQTYPISEILIQDDHSTDDTLSIARSYARSHSFIRVLLNESAPGFNGNFLSAMRKATGEYIAICDQDDLWHPQKLELQMAAIGHHLLCVCRSKPFSDDGVSVAYDPRTPNYHPIRLLYCSIPGHTMLLHRRLLSLLPPQDHDYHTNYDVLLSLTAAANDSVVLVDRFLVNWRRHAGAATYEPVDRRRSPSMGNGLYILGWSLWHHRQMQPILRTFFQRRQSLLRGIRADSPLYDDALAIAGETARGGFLGLLRLCRLHVKHRHHLFYAEGRGITNLLRAVLYGAMQPYYYRFLLPPSR